MAIVGYGVLVGRVVGVSAAKKKSPHYEILIAAKQKFRIAINIASDGEPHDVLYLVDQDYRHELLDKLRQLGDGFTKTPPRPGGLALDFVRGNLFDTSRMRPLSAIAGKDNDLNKQVDAVMQRALGDGAARVYVFGQYATGELHDIHMNQGNRGEHARDNGTWQDGALFVHFPDADRWVAIFTAFQSQTLQTDDRGNAIGAEVRPKKKAPLCPQAPLGISLEPRHIAANELSPRTVLAGQPG